MSTAKIYHGDACVILRQITDRVDAVVCDPPYNLSYQGHEWDTFASGRAFEAWCSEWAEGLQRVLKPGGVVLAFGATRMYHRLACGLADAGFDIGAPLLWAYSQGFPRSPDLGKDAPGFEGWRTVLKPAWEPIVVAYRPGEPRELRDGPVLNVPKPSTQERVVGLDPGDVPFHPTVKPVEVMRRLIRAIGIGKGEVVLDPFMGSGSTGLACEAEGVDFIGIERDPEYAEKARLRLFVTEFSQPGVSVTETVGGLI